MMSPRKMYVFGVYLDCIIGVMNLFKLSNGLTLDVLTQFSLPSFLETWNDEI